MSQPNLPRIILIAALAALTTACATTTSTQPRGTDSPATRPPKPVIDGAGTDATAVSRAALTIMWSYDAATPEDARQGQRAAYLRARPYLTPDYLHQITTNMPATPLPSALVEHRARSSTALERLPNESGETDTSVDAARTWRITTTPHGRDGWRGRRTTAYLYVRLTRPGPWQPWRIDSISVH